MPFAIFTVPLYHGEPALKELNAFLANRRILRVDRRLVEHGEESAWTFCVDYLEQKTQTKEDSSSSKQGVDYRPKMDDDQFETYDELRELRKKLSQESGLPLYKIFTNEQLYRMVVDRVTTVAALKKVPRVGHSRVEKYGEAFVAILQRTFGQQAEADSQGDAKQKAESDEKGG